MMLAQHLRHERNPIFAFQDFGVEESFGERKKEVKGKYNIEHIKSQSVKNRKFSKLNVKIGKNIKINAMQYTILKTINVHSSSEKYLNNN